MHNFCLFVEIELEVSGRVVSSGVLYKLRYTELLWYNHIWDQTHLDGLNKIIQINAFNNLYFYFLMLLSYHDQYPQRICLMRFISECIHNCWGQCKYFLLPKYCITSGFLTLSTHPFFRLNCCLSLDKSHRKIRQAFTRDVFEPLLEKASEAGHINLQRVQLCLEVGIKVNVFFIFMFLC